MLGREVVAAMMLTVLSVAAQAQRHEMHIGQEPGLDLPRAPPPNFLAKCLAEPADRMSCEIARSSRQDGGLESKIAGRIDAVVYVSCTAKAGVCLEVATFDPEEAPAAEGPKTARMPAIDIEVLFDYDRADVRAAEAAKLEQIATALRHPAAADALFVIVGHTDAKGSEAHNCRLSAARARSVRDRLGALGVAADRLTTIGVGKLVLRDGADPLGEVNRRVAFARQTGTTDAIVARLSGLCRGYAG